MLMNVLASALLFLFVGPFKHASSGGTKEAGVSMSQVKEVYIAVNDTLKLNCSLNASIYNIHLAHVEWRHNALTPINFAYLLNNNTIQLRKNHTQYDDAGVYECGLFNSSKFQSLQKIVVVVGERPKIISVQQFNVSVYGWPAQKVIVKWPALQENVTNELIFGRVPAGNFFCEFNSTAQCRITPEFQNEMLSCDIGMDVLGKMFQRNELLNECNATRLSRCDSLCAKLLVKNSFGVSKTDSTRWNLKHEAQCPPLHNLTVSFGEHHLIVRWQHPELVEEDILSLVKYRVGYFTISLLTGKKSPLQYPEATTQYALKIDMIKPFARYTFEAACQFDWYKWGPPVYTKVTTKEAEPSEAPSSCEVMNSSRHESLVSFKLPPIDSWNGIPMNFRVYYGDQMAVFNTSLAELQTLYNRSEPSVIKLKNLDPRKNYTVRVAMCTGGGCGDRSEPCFIPDNIEDDSNKNVVANRDHERNHTVVITWLAIAIGAVAGLLLVALIVSLIRRKRRQRKERPSLDSILGPLNGIHAYENPFDDAPSFCEDDQCYDSIDDLIPRRLLADGAVGNLPLTEI